MCGIIGYSGTENCIPILIKGLKNLEYRGYDSSGIAFFEGEKSIPENVSLKYLEDVINTFNRTHTVT